MGQYKVPQNVEAEDKILGPLTLKQFIFVIIGLGWGFFTLTIFRGVPVLFVLVGIPPAILFLLLGLYQPQDQPFESRFLAMVSYFGKPRQRLWQKDPIFEVFKVEPTPPKPEMATKDISEMRGQLEKLVRIVDTRGAQTKSPSLQEPVAMPDQSLESRIAAPPYGGYSFAGPQAEEHDITAQDDILDFQNNPSAQSLNQLIENSVKNIRQEALAKMSTTSTPPLAPASKPVAQPGAAGAAAMKQTASPDILKLSMEGELKVSQLAAQAQRQTLKEGQAVTLRPQGGV